MVQYDTGKVFNSSMKRNGKGRGAKQRLIRARIMDTVKEMFLLKKKKKKTLDMLTALNNLHAREKIKSQCLLKGVLCGQKRRRDYKTEVDSDPSLFRTIMLD